MMKPKIIKCALVGGVIALLAASWFLYRIAYSKGYSDGGIQGVNLTRTELYENAVAIKNRCAHKSGSYTVRYVICDSADRSCVKLGIYCAEDFWP